MPAAQHAFLRILRHVRDLTLVFAWGTHINERLVTLALCQRFIKKRANLLVEAFLRHRIICLCILRHFTCHRPLLGLPFVAAAVENFHFLVAKQAECPERVTPPPIRFVAVKNAGRLRRDSVTTAKLRKFFWRNVIANHRIL